MPKQSDLCQVCNSRPCACGRQCKVCGKLICTCIIQPKQLSRLAERKVLDKKENWVVQDLFERGEVHLTVGPSGVGKSSWLLPMIKDWSEGKDILGHKSYPEPYVYIVCDRSFNMTRMTLNRLGLQDWDINFFAIDEFQKQLKRRPTLQELAKRMPYIKMFFIEAIGYFEPTENGKGLSYGDSLKFWTDVRSEFAEDGKTIHGTTHSPKMKGKDKYGNGRESPIGSVAQGAIAATIIRFDFEDDFDCTNKGRLLGIYPRNFPNILLKSRVDESGKIVYDQEVDPKEINGGIEVQSATYLIHKELIKSNNQVGDLINSDTVQGWRERTGISRQHMTRLLKAMCDSGILRLINKNQGIYRLERPISALVIQ